MNASWYRRPLQRWGPYGRPYHADRLSASGTYRRPGQELDPPVHIMWIEYLGIELWEGTQKSAEVGHVWNAKITRSRLQLRSMTDLGGPKGTKDGKSKWVWRTADACSFLLFYCWWFLASSAAFWHSSLCFRAIFLCMLWSHYFLKPLLTNRACVLHFSKSSNPGRFYLRGSPCSYLLFPAGALSCLHASSPLSRPTKISTRFQTFSPSHVWSLPLLLDTSSSKSSIFLP